MLQKLTETLYMIWIWSFIKMFYLQYYCRIRYYFLQNHSSYCMDCLHFFVLIHNKRLEAHIAHLSDLAKYFDQSSFMKTNKKILIQNVFCCFSYRCFNILKFKTISGCIDTHKKNFTNCSMVIFNSMF